MASRPAEITGCAGGGGSPSDRRPTWPSSRRTRPFAVDAAQLHHKNPITPYDGRTVTAWCGRAISRGEQVVLTGPQRGEMLSAPDVDPRLPSSPCGGRYFTPSAASRPRLPRPGGQRGHANDELFAPRQNLIVPTIPVHAIKEFGHTGKIYDGWETRRRRDPGYDWAIVRLGVPGVVHGVVVDTAFFKGNYPPFISIEAASVEGYPTSEALEDLSWVTLVAKTPCDGDTENYYDVDDLHRWTHVRLTIYPDGGVARFRVHGEAVPDPRFLTTTRRPAGPGERGPAARHLRRLLLQSGEPDLVEPSPDHGRGWENARRRGPGNDWAIFQLGARGEPTMLEVDTSYFIGNAPGEVRVSAADALTSDLADPSAWWDVVPRTRVLNDTRHRFLAGERRPATHLRLDVYPDGGLTRLRCYGELLDEDRKQLYERFWDLLPAEHREFPETVPVPPDRVRPADQT